MSEKIPSSEELCKMHPEASKRIRRALSFPLHNPIEIISGSDDWKIKTEPKPSNGVGIASFAITVR